jgi:hypothetical protein
MRDIRYVPKLAIACNSSVAGMRCNGVHGINEDLKVRREVWMRSEGRKTRADPGRNVVDRERSEWASGGQKIRADDTSYSKRCESNHVCSYVDSSMGMVLM